MFLEDSPNPSIWRIRKASWLQRSFGGEFRPHFLQHGQSCYTEPSLQKVLTRVFYLLPDQCLKELECQTSLLKDCQETDRELVYVATWTYSAHGDGKREISRKQLGCKSVTVFLAPTGKLHVRTSRNSSYFSLTAESVRLLNSVP